MNNMQAALQQKEDTKRMVMHFARQYEQKLTEADQAEERFRRAPPAFAKNAEAMLEVAMRERQEALEVFQYASDEATKAGWSKDEGLAFALEAARQQRAETNGSRRRQRVLKRTKVRKARKARKTTRKQSKRSKHRKSFTRKNKHKHRA
jgi:hypothetical protein